MITNTFCSQAFLIILHKLREREANAEETKNAMGLKMRFGGNVC